MPPQAEDCESARLYDEAPAAVHGGRVRPARPPAAPARAWLQHEQRRLLSPSRLQAGLTLGLHCDYPQKTPLPIAYKSKLQKRKEKLLEVLKPPYFILSMIVLIIAVHLCGSEAVRALLEWAPAAWRAQPWRLLTYGLLHAHAAHLALNALVALAVGWQLEREQGWWRVGAVWAGGVAGGALGAGALQPRVHVVGASAAVYALLTAHLANVALRFGHIPLWWFRPLAVVVLGASEGAWALLCGERAPPTCDHVAWAAHVLGAALGVPLAFLIFTGEHERRGYVWWARVASALALAALATLAAMYFTFWEEAP